MFTKLFLFWDSRAWGGYVGLVWQGPDTVCGGDIRPTEGEGCSSQLV